MGKKEISRVVDEFSQQSPDIDSFSQANLIQVPENEIDVPRQKILFSVSGNYFQRVSPLIKEHFPQIVEKVQTQTRQVRLIAITDQDGYGLSFQAWSRDEHGEFEDTEKCPLKLQQLQDLLEDVALDTDQSVNVFATYQDLRNTRKRSGGASTKAVPKR